jgi:hypothetical protein
MREVLEKCEDYQCAHDKFANTTVSSPVYFIVAGAKKNEGAVISRSNEKSINVTSLSDTQWYLVQTNEDHFKGICTARC